jgi:hypothetical protein
MAMFPGELQEVSPLKLGHEIELVRIQVPEVELGNGRGGCRKFLYVASLLITNKWIVTLDRATTGRHFFGLDESPWKL